MRQQRDWNIDYLRILACLMVIILHVSGQNFRIIPVTSFEWRIFNLFDVSVRSCVPIFFMISGSLFLSKKEISIKHILTKNVWKLIVIYFVWSTFYALVKYQGNDLIKGILASEFHLWYLPSLISIYLLCPVLWAIVNSNNEKILNYTCFLLIIGGLLHNFVYLEPLYNQNIVILLSKFSTISLGYCGYFLWGYYLTKNKEKYIHISRKVFVIIFVVTIFIATIINDRYALYIGSPTTLLYEYMDIPVFIEATCLFVIFMKNRTLHLSKNKELYIKRISKYTLFIYLIHPFVMEQLRIQFQITSLTFSGILWTPLLSVFIFFICLILAYFIDKIPFINKWIM